MDALREAAMPRSLVKGNISVRRRETVRGRFRLGPGSDASTSSFSVTSLLEEVEAVCWDEARADRVEMISLMISALLRASISSFSSTNAHRRSRSSLRNF